MKLMKAAALGAALLLTAQTQALNILLTNDDGFGHPWIRTLHAALLEAGHEVTMVAPADNQSGQSAALSLGALMAGEDILGHPEPGVYTVAGTPATAVIVGVAKVLPTRPDLVVSGPNDGANIGVLSSASGTVGATVAALNLLGAPIPAIAISSNRLDVNSAANSEVNLAHAGDIADFMVRLVAALEANQERTGELLPHGIALNVNYPAVVREDVKGVGIYRHGRDVGVDFSRRGLAAVAPHTTATEGAEDAKRIEGAAAHPTPLAAGDGASARTPADQAPADKSSAEWDTGALRDGYITIVPIDGDYTAENWREVLPASILENLMR